MEKERIKSNLNQQHEIINKAQMNLYKDMMNLKKVTLLKRPTEDPPKGNSTVKVEVKDDLSKVEVEKVLGNLKQEWDGGTKREGESG